MIITRNTSTTPQALRDTMSITQSMFRVAAVQMASGPHVTANLQEAGRVPASWACPNTSRSWA